MNKLVVHEMLEGNRWVSFPKRALREGFFFFNDTATTEIYTLSLHDALPISKASSGSWATCIGRRPACAQCRDRKSTRLNSSHQIISYAVFCLKKKKKINGQHSRGSALPAHPRMPR